MYIEKIFFMEIAESDLLITIINYILDFLKALFIIEYSI